MYPGHYRWTVLTNRWW